MKCYIAKVGTTTCTLAADIPAKPALKTVGVYDNKDGAVDAIALALEGITRAYNATDAEKNTRIDELYEKFDKKGIIEKKGSRYVSIGVTGSTRHCRFDAEVEESQMHYSA